MISIYPKDKSIYLSTYNTKNFTQIIEALKQFKCSFNPNTKDWELTKVHYAELIEVLEELDEIRFTNQDLINKYLCPESTIVTQRVGFDYSDLKYPPIIGKAPYENFQIEDLQRTVSRNRFALFLDVGTGKSWIILSGINILRKQGKMNKILYITSNSGVYDIKEKFLMFTDIPEDRIQIGNKNNRRPFDIDCDVIICNYRSFLLISDEYQKDKDKGKKHTKEYRSTPIPIANWIQDRDACCVLDESHNIAIPTSRQTKVIHLIKGFFNYRYLLSGTPADKEEKYYSQLKFLDDSLVKDWGYYEWLDYYANLGTRFSQYAIASFKPKKILELQEIIRNNCSRRLGEDVLDLPPNIIKELFITISPLQENIYQEFIKARLRLIQSANGSISKQSFTNIFPKLLMAVDNPERIDLNGIDDLKLKGLVSKFKFVKDHPKVDVVLDILADHPDSKVIIWTSHPSVGFAMTEVLKDKNPFILNGEIELPPKMTREEYKNKIVEEFKKSKDRHILIAGTQVLNTAVTIVEANVQIYIDTDYNYTTTEQSVARIYRIGQKNKVYTYKILIKHTLDVTRNEIMKNKDYLNDHFLSKDYIDQKSLQDIILGGKL